MTISTSKFRPRRRRDTCLTTAAVAAAVAAAVTASRESRAEVYTYNSAVGAWHDPNKWSHPGIPSTGVPGANDTAIVEISNGVVALDPYQDSVSGFVYHSTSVLNVYIGNNEVISLNPGPPHDNDGNGEEEPPFHAFNADQMFLGTVSLKYGTFSQPSSNTASAFNQLYLGKLNDATGIVTLGGGSMNSTFAAVGHFGNGFFNHNGGTFTVDDMNIGDQPSSSGTYTLAPNALLVSFGGFNVGADGTGAFNQNGGAVRFLIQNGTATFTAGMHAGSTGAVNVQGGVFGDLTESGIAPNAVIAESGAASFNLGGPATVNFGVVNVGLLSNSAGSVGLAAGTFNADTLTVGNAGIGAVSYSNGAALRITSPGDNALILGNQAGSRGTFDFDAALLEVGIPGNREWRGSVTVGNLGVGVFTQTRGSLLALDLTVARAAQGTFRATVGSIDLTGSLSVATDTGSQGHFVLGSPGGTSQVTLNVDGNARFGEQGAATVVQYANTSATVRGNVSISTGGGAASTYQMMGGSSLWVDQGADNDATGGTLTVTGSAGNFTQAAGSTVRAKNLMVGSGAGHGTYSLDGALTVRNQTVIGDGFGAIGTFSGGTSATHTTGSLDIASWSPVPGNPSTYDHSGTLSVGRVGWAGTHNGNIVIGEVGTQLAAFAHVQGTVTASGTVTLGSLGEYAMQAGTLNAAALVLQPTSLTNDGFLQSGGTVNVQTLDNGGYVSLSGSATFNATTSVVVQSFGTMTHAIATLTTPSLTNHGTYNLTAGTLSVGGAAYNDGTFNQSGGQFSANSFTNDFNGIATHSGGTASFGTFTNRGTFNQTGDGLTVSNPIDNQGAFNYSGGTVTAPVFNNSASNATFTHTAGSFSIPTFSNTGTASIQTGTFNVTALANQGQFNQTGGTANVTTISGTNGTTTIGAGAGAATLNSHSIRQHNLTVAGGGLVALAPDQTSAGTSVLDELHIDTANGGKLDLAKNHLVIKSTPLEDVRDLIKAAYNVTTPPHWTSPGLTSSDAAAAPNDRALGYAHASDIFVSSFGGESVASTDVLVRWTIMGDANLDGMVNFADNVALSQHYNTSGDWAQGDFNYDGTVNFADLVLLSQHYNMSLPPPAAPVPAFAVVPEPAVGTLLVTAVSLTARRRRRR